MADNLLIIDCILSDRGNTNYFPICKKALCCDIEPESTLAALVASSADSGSI